MGKEYGTFNRVYGINFLGTKKTKLNLYFLFFLPKKKSRLIKGINLKKRKKEKNILTAKENISYLYSTEWRNILNNFILSNQWHMHLKIRSKTK